MAGFFGQRLYLGHKTKNYSDKLHVDEDKCIGCGKCEKLCPMNNIKIVDKKWCRITSVPCVIGASIIARSKL